MNPFRERAKQQFPTVLLTLLSIVQALSLELWWQFASSYEFLYDGSLGDTTILLQAAATLICIVAVWLVYASMAMRFRWVPATVDSVYPFVAGLFQFMLIDSLYHEDRGIWFIDVGLVFLCIISIIQFTMRRARGDADNALFFLNVEPAKARDFLPQLALIGAFLVVGLVVKQSSSEWIAFLAAVAANVVVLVQIVSTRRFWKESMEAEAPEGTVEEAPEEA